MSMPLRFFTAVLVSIPCIFLHAEGASSTDSLSLNLKGSVSELREYSGADPASVILHRTILFDDKGHPISEKVLDSSGNEKSNTVFSYTAGGMILDIKGSGADGSLKWRYSYTYDDGSRLLKESSFDSKGSLEWWDDYRYRDDGFLIEKLRYSAAGEVTLQDSYQYDDTKKLSQRTTLYADGKLLKRVSFFYDANALLSREDHYDANGIYEQVEYTYNADRRLIATKDFAPDGSIRQIQQDFYDAAGRLTQEKVSVSGNPASLTVVSYGYDDRGNWIRRTEAPGSCTTREIQYKD